MKFFSWWLCLCLSMNVLASTNSLQALEKGMDDYNFALTVEWDQKDKDFYNQKTEIFFKQVREAISEGVTKDELLTLVKSRTKNPKALEAIQLKMDILSNQADSQKELAELLRISSQEFYHQGASWNGDVALYTGFGILAAALLGYAIWWNIKYKCVNEERYRDCDWETDRDGDRDYECRNKTRCLEWVER